MISVFSDKARSTFSNEKFVESEIKQITCLIIKKGKWFTTVLSLCDFASIFSVRIANNYMHTKQELPNNN